MTSTVAPSLLIDFRTFFPSSWLVGSIFEFIEMCRQVLFTIEKMSKEIPKRMVTEGGTADTS